MSDDKVTSMVPVSIRVPHDGPIPKVCGLCEGDIEEAGEFGPWCFANLPPASKAICMTCCNRHEPILAAVLALAWRAESELRGEAAANAH